MSELSVRLHTIDDRVKYSAVSRENPEIIIDYFPPFGEGEGYTSLELLLVSLASCLSTTMLTLIRGKMKKTITSLAVEASGTTRDTHPKAFTHIRRALTVTSRPTSRPRKCRRLSTCPKKSYARCVPCSRAMSK